MDRSLAPERPAKKPAKAKADADFETNQWKGLTNYLCPDCPFASLERAEVEEHVRRRHRRNTKE